MKVDFQRVKTKRNGFLTENDVSNPNKEVKRIFKGKFRKED